MLVDNDIEPQFDFVPMDMNLRRGGQHILTTDSLPDLIPAARAMTQGSLPDLHEAFDRYNSGLSDELGSVDGSTSQVSSYMSEHSDQPPRNWSVKASLGNDAPPDETQERGRPRLAELGTEVPVRSASVGNVRGVVTDSDHEHVKVMYFLNSKACFKTVGRDDFLKELEAAQASIPSQQEDDAAHPQQNPPYASRATESESEGITSVARP
mmetsp:Transcript_101754/g.202049  ORF Transcript_101754/g.202049 Transcript_101754/m.202049 type:complete len:210 (-) Transcript_101754:278-907(-)